VIKRTYLPLNQLQQDNTAMQISITPQYPLFQKIAFGDATPEIQAIYSEIVPSLAD